MRLFAHLCVVLLLCFAGCSKDIVETTGNIVGTIRDARTNNLIEGASVTLKDEGGGVITGSDGKYHFMNKEGQKTYTVLVSKSGYKSDSKTILVKAGADNTLDFALTPSVAELAISQTTLDFGNKNTTLTFNIKNTGSAALTWSISEDAAWLSCTPTSGTTQAGETSAVVVNVSRDGLERGNYSQSMAISSNGGSEVVRVNMAVQGISVSFSPETLDFGSTTTSMQLTIKNNGSGNISYAITPSNEWIKVDKKTGVFSSTENINVSVDRSTFSAGDYAGSLTVRIGSEDIVIPIRMNIPTKEQPTVSLYSVDNITFSSALFRGAIVSIGSAKVVKHGFCWGTAEEPTLENSQSCNFGDCSAAKDFTYNATSLTSNTTYYVRTYAENAEGVSYSNAIKFQTAGVPERPTVETGTVSGILTSQATVSGNIISLGNVEEITQYGHAWSTKANPTTGDQRTEQGRTAQTGSFTSTMTGLSPNTTYHVRAYATNSVGTAYGDDMTFTTALGDIVLQTSNATNITFNSATVGCMIKETGGHTISECGVCWSTNHSPVTSDTHKTASTAKSTYEVVLDNLKANTKYYVCAYAKSESGQIFYGNEISFTTNEKDININKNGYDNDKSWER